MEFKVSDIGIGIPSDVMPRIFDKFYQAYSSATRSYGGMGLGLYIVKSFTEFPGGTVTAESKAGLGSTFIITIPESYENCPGKIV